MRRPSTPGSPVPFSGGALGDAALLVAARDSVRLQELAESISTGIMEFDVGRGGCVWVNQAYLDLVERDLVEVLGSGWVRTVHPDDLGVVQAAREQRGRSRFRVRHVLPSGGVRHIDVTIVPLEVDEAAGGARVRSVVSVHDVTGSVEQAGRDLRHERRFRRMFDSAAVGMAVCAPGGLVLDVNPAYCSVLRIDADQVLGHRLQDVVLSDDGPFRWESAVAALQAGIPLPVGEQHVRRPDGTFFWAQASMALGDGDDGEEVVIAQLLDVDEQHRQRLELAHRADHDELTGLANRAAVLAAVSRGLLTREGFLAVLFCDLDHFKNVNDSLGHATGDEVLRAVAQRLRGTVRSGDLVGRLGGDEFVVLLRDVEDPSHAQVTAARVGAALSVPVAVAGQQLTCGVSVGITVVDLAARPADLDADCLLRDADTAMYDAKGSGRGTFRVFTDEMRDRAVRRLAVENDLRRAVEGRELVVHYQPVVDLADGRRVGFEALVRWQHPERGLLLPGEFLGVAQDCGLANALDDVVLEDALGFLARHPEVRVSVNVSPRRFDGSFAARVAEGLARHGVPGSRLAVELLETALLEATPGTVGEVEALAGLGCPVLIDDFGTGYSALAYLRRLPVTGLKLDRSFVADLPHDENADRIASAVVALSEGFGLLSVAEGVETVEQAEHLRRQGVAVRAGVVLRPARGRVALVRVTAARPGAWPAALGAQLPAGTSWTPWTGPTPAGAAVEGPRHSGGLLQDVAVAAGRAFRVALVGAGIGPSLSPALHEREAARLGLDYSYARWDLGELGLPPTAVGDLVHRARALGFAGLNVTHPCKQLVLPHLDALTPDAQALGAVNTVVIGPPGGPDPRDHEHADHRTTTGHNTDWSGFARSFERGLPGAALGHVALVGAGGAGAAVAHALLVAGTRRLTVVDADPGRARTLTAAAGARFADRRVAAHPVDDLPALLGRVDGVVHATPTGMVDHPGLPFDVAALAAGAWVAEVVYRPLETELLRAARAAGHPVLDGGGMAVVQAAQSLRAFTGVRPDEARMLEHLAVLVA